MNLEIDELVKAINSTMNDLRDRVGPSIEIRHDYYWRLLHEARYQLDRAPTEIDITAGQLSDDIIDVRTAACADATPLSLRPIASIMDYISTFWTEMGDEPNDNQSL